MGIQARKIYSYSDTREIFDAFHLVESVQNMIDRPEAFIFVLLELSVKTGEVF